MLQKLILMKLTLILLIIPIFDDGFIASGGSPLGNLFKLNSIGDITSNI